MNEDQNRKCRSLTNRKCEQKGSRTGSAPRELNSRTNRKCEQKRSRTGSAPRELNSKVVHSYNYGKYGTTVHRYTECTYTRPVSMQYTRTYLWIETADISEMLQGWDDPLVVLFQLTNTATKPLHLAIVSILRRTSKKYTHTHLSVGR